MHIQHQQHSASGIRRNETHMHVVIHCHSTCCAVCGCLRRCHQIADRRQGSIPFKVDVTPCEKQVLISCAHLSISQAVAAERRNQAIRCPCITA